MGFISVTVSSTKMKIPNWNDCFDVSQHALIRDDIRSRILILSENKDEDIMCPFSVRIINTCAWRFVVYLFIHLNSYRKVP